MELEEDLAVASTVAGATVRVTWVAWLLVINWAWAGMATATAKPEAARAKRPKLSSFMEYFPRF
jgi:hypothetical protein